MFTVLNESVSVVAVYAANTLKPRKILWRGVTYPVEKITLVSDLTEGVIKRRIYSIVLRSTLYRLEFNRTTEHWTLLEVYCE